jgi:hypothetical protein
VSQGDRTKYLKTLRLKEISFKEEKEVPAELRGVKHKMRWRNLEITQGLAYHFKDVTFLFLVAQPLMSYKQ